MDRSFAESPTGYVERISAFVHSDARGRVYQPLADFLRKETQNSDGDQATNTSARNFVVYYAVRPNVQVLLTPQLDPSTLPNVDMESLSSGCGGRLIFLRGYPSSQWLSVLGQYYHIRPEYWRRHLGFLSSTDMFSSNSHVLPSTVGRIFQLSVGSIGSLGRWWKPGQSVKDLRRAAVTNMVSYNRNLNAGLGWKPADSVVRRYILHDKEHFSIEQSVTVYLHTGENEEEWVVFVYLDCGNDLATSPKGPWNSGQDRNSSLRLLSTPTDTSDDVLTSQRWKMPTERAEVSQSLSQIHLKYGETLNPNARSKDPFYLLNEFFQQYTLTENQTLDFVAYKIEKYNIGSDLDSVESDGFSIAHPQLLHFQTFLEHRIQHLEDTLRFIRRRGGTLWKRPPPEQLPEHDETDAAATSLLDDVEYLHKRAKDLLSKIERSTSLRMNLTGIDESKRSNEVGAMVFRFTAVASFYIPLSFTAGFFGMNFHELGTGTLSIWTFFVASIPIMVISVLCLSPWRSQSTRLDLLRGSKVV